MGNTNLEQIGSNVVVFEVETDVLASTSLVLRGKLRELMAGGARNIAMDLKSVRMVDSAGLGLIIATHNSLKKVGGELVLMGCSPDILELFRSMRIHQHMKIEGAEATRA